MTIKIPGLEDLPPDNVIHEVIQTLAQLHIEFDLRGPLAVQGTWQESRFSISVLEQNGDCSLRIERLPGGTMGSFQEAYASICEALERNASGF